MSGAAELSDTECDVFFFSVGGRMYGTDPRDIAQVDRLQSTRHRAVLEGTGHCERGLIVREQGREIEIPVESVVGVRRTPRNQLRPVPHFLARMLPELASELLGLMVVEGQAPILMLDLKQVSTRAQPADSRTVSTHG